MSQFTLPPLLVDQLWEVSSSSSRDEAHFTLSLSLDLSFGFLSASRPQNSRTNLSTFLGKITSQAGAHLIEFALGTRGIDRTLHILIPRSKDCRRHIPIFPTCGDYLNAYHHVTD